VIHYTLSCSTSCLLGSVDCICLSVYPSIGVVVAMRHFSVISYFMGYLMLFISADRYRLLQMLLLYRI